MSTTLWNENSLIEMVEKYGVKNIRFFVPLLPTRRIPMWNIAYTTMSDDEVTVECEIVEDRYKVADGYKIQLVPVSRDPDSLGRVFSGNAYYQMDLKTLLRRNKDEFKVYVLLDEPVTYQRITVEW